MFPVLLVIIYLTLIFIMENAESSPVEHEIHYDEYVPRNVFNESTPVRYLKRTKVLFQEKNV